MSDRWRWGAPAAVVAAVLFMAPVAPAAADTPQFSVFKLKGGTGGEPSMATDGKGDVYVTGPLGIPQGIAGKSGVALWASRDGGQTFGPVQNIGSYSGGGDSDVAVPPGDDQTVYAADLLAWASEVCVSRDGGKTYAAAGPAPDPNHCTVVSTGNYGPVDDRQWVTADRGGLVYLNYHDFGTGQPQFFRDDAYGAHGFTDGPCAPMVNDPAIEANVLSTGTRVAKPVIDAQGNLYVVFVTSTPQERDSAVQHGKTGGNASQAYIAVSTDHCQSWVNHTIYDGNAKGTNSVQFGDDFNVTAVDSAGNLYVAAAGYVGTETYPTPQTAQMYLMSSRDHGATWTQPADFTAGDHSAHMLPAIIAGNNPGELALGYFRTVNGVTDPNDSNGKWVYEVAETSDATAPTPTFQFTDVNNGLIYHYGDICNSGTVCGTPVPGAGKDRSLLDFTSAVIGAADCPLFTFAGNPRGGGGTLNYVARQSDGCFGRFLGGGSRAAESSSSPAPAAPVAAPAPPPSPSPRVPLPNTGAGMGIAIFTVVLLLGTLAFARLTATAPR